MDPEIGYEMSQSGGTAFGIAYFLFMLALYGYFGYCLMVISQKTGIGTGWWGFVPILNIILMLQIAGKPTWWILLLFIPIVSIIVAIIVWMKIAEARGKPSWWGILLLVPLVNLAVPGYLAFAD